MKTDIENHKNSETNTDSATLESEQHVSIGIRLGNLLHAKGYYDMPTAEDVNNILPGDIPDFNKQVNKYGVLAYYNQDWANVAEKTQEISGITMRLFGTPEKVIALYNELSEKFNVVKAGSMMMGILTLKIEDPQVMKKKLTA